MDTVINASELTHRTSVIAVPVEREDDLAFFHALWFWIPAGLALWAAIIYTLMRLV